MADLYKNKFLSAVYNSVNMVFMEKAGYTGEDVPLEFIALTRKAAQKFFEGSEVTAAYLSEVLPGRLPPSLSEAAIMTEGDGFRVFDPEQEFAIDVEIPASDEMVGEIPDMPFELNESFPTLPTAVLSDERMGQMDAAIQKVLSADRTTGVDAVPMQTPQPPVGADAMAQDYTGPMEPVPNE